jgi:hypothetical protein
MKKVFSTICLFFSFYFCTAQLINGFGLTGGISYGNEKFIFAKPLSTIENKKYILGFNGSAFVEFLHGDYIRWVTELQYNQKGSKDEQSAGTYTNKLQYGCFNNYLKLRTELYSIIPYILLGPRIEYAITQKTGSPVITDAFTPLHISPAVGAGIEFVSYGNIKFMMEAFYNPDILYAYQTEPLNIYNKNFEFRIGLKYVPGKRSTCNMPRA